MTEPDVSQRIPVVSFLSTDDIQYMYMTYSHNIILNKSSLQKKLSGHAHIVQFYSAASISKEESDHGQAEFLLLMEYCSKGQLVDILRQRQIPLTCNEVLPIFYQTCRAVAHMHSQNPPMIHRDLKVG